MHLVDHVFLFVLLIVAPIHGALALRKILRKIEAGERAYRVKLYRETTLVEWAALAVLSIAWYLLSRPAADLGLVLPTGAAGYAGAAVVALATILLTWSWMRTRRMTLEDKARHAKALGKLAFFLPQNAHQFRNFVALSVTAGIVEEIVYRGFVIWYLTQFMPIWAAVIVSSLVFGLGHSYQGTSGATRAGLVGLVFAVLYVSTGSILLPIIAHAVLDILQGAYVFEILRDTPREPAASRKPREPEAEPS